MIWLVYSEAVCWLYYVVHTYNLVSAISVPATAGTQKRQGLSEMNGRKGCVDGQNGYRCERIFGEADIEHRWSVGYMRLVGGSGRVVEEQYP